MTTENALYIDLLVTGEDITLDTGKQPILCNNRVSISQDIKHALLESGLVTALIGERSRVLRSDKQISGRHNLLMQIVRQYGRTCRRYEFSTINGQEIVIRHGEFNHTYQCFPVSINL